MAREQQLHLNLTKKENKTLRDRYKKYVARTVSTEIVEFNPWARGELLKTK